MSSKVIFVFAQALLIQSVFSQCLNRGAIDAFGAGPFGYSGYGLAGSALAYDGLAPANWAGRACDVYPAAASAIDFTPTSGGGLPVSSASAYAPIGLSVVSENAYEGILAVTGELPFVGTTRIDGVVPSAGSGAINHSCGNGLNIMSALSDTSSPASVATSGFAAPYGLSAPYARTAPFNAPAYANAGLAAPVLAASAYPSLAAPGLVAPAAGIYDTVGYADGIEFTTTSGGNLPVSSASAVAPTGISVASETAYEGPLTVVGELPFVGTVGLEGVLPTAGAGAVNHACGNGINAMSAAGEAFGAYGAYGAYGPAAAIAPGYAASGLAAPGFAAPGLAAPGLAAPGYAARWAGKGCGCGF